MTGKEVEALALSRFKANEDLISKRAKENIEKYRKGDFSVTLCDAKGEPLAGKTVKVTQKTHDFKVGANLFMLDQYETQEENTAFRELFPQYFNLATVPFSGSISFQ